MLFRKIILILFFILSSSILIFAQCSFQYVSAGSARGNGIKSNGTLWAWGRNAVGQLGDGTNSNRFNPVQIGADTNWSSVTEGYSYQHSLGIKSNGTLWGWGLNTSGQLGDGSTINRNSPVQIGSGNNWVKAAAGFQHSIYLKSDGTIWGSGGNSFGQLGDGTFVNKITPIQIGTGNSWSDVSVGYRYSLAIKNDGTLWGWGYNAYGQLGDGTTTNRNIPVQIGSSTNWVMIRAGGSHSLGIKSDGTLWAWGWNVTGQLGLGSTSNQNHPFQVGTATNWIAIAPSWSHSLALKSDSTLWAWGNNYNGHLGDGTYVNKYNPVQIGTESNWISIAASGHHSFGLKNNGSIWSWGLNSNGQLGDGTTTQRNSPTLISLLCLTASITKVNDANCGLANGKAYVAANDGTPPYTYSWSDGSSVVSATDTLFNAGVGTYIVTVTDASSSTSSSTVVIGAGIGQVSTNTISASACHTYTSPISSKTWTTSGTYIDTTTNAAGCDSILTINLTINSSTALMANASATTLCAGDSLILSGSGLPPVGWSYIGSAGFSAGHAYFQSLAIDGNGTPYVAYKDYGGNSSKTTVMKFNGSNWVNVGSAGFSAGVANFQSLALDGSGTPYVAYQDHADAAKTTVMKFNGSNWVNVGSAGFSAGATFEQSLAIDGSGTPFVAYQDQANANKTTVMKFNGSNWVNVGSAGFSAGGADGQSLAIDGSGTLYVAYIDYANGSKTTVMKFNGSNWVNVGNVGFSAFWAYTPSLAIDGSGTPYVAYQDGANGNKTTVMKFNGSNWVNVGSAGFSAGWAHTPSLVIDGSGTPFVAYQDVANADKTTVMKFNGSSWINVGSAGFSAGGVLDPSLAIDGSGAPYVAYHDQANSYGTSVMKFNAGGSYTWTSGSNSYTDSVGFVPAATATYTLTGTDANSCTSTSTVQVTVNSNSTNTISATACNAYTSPSTNHTWTTSGTHKDTLTNAAGCDSIITINLTINNSTNNSISATACNSYTSPISSKTWTTSGTYMDTTTNAAGCDSVLTINLTINNSSSTTISASACNTYTSPISLKTWATSGTYMDTTTNAAGCDSVLTINLTISNSTNNTISATACNTYTSLVSSKSWTTSGTYMDTTTNANGCDSILTINLTINPLPIVTTSQTAVSQCINNASYLTASGALTYSSSLGVMSNDTLFIPVNSTTGNYIVTGTDANGCSATTSVAVTITNANGTIALATPGNMASTPGSISSSSFQMNNGLTHAHTTINCRAINYVLEPAGGNSLGNVLSTVTVNPTTPFYNGQPYVARWYKITPSNQGPATVTLFFTDDDFIKYNANNGTFPDIPTNANSATTASNLAVTKTNGTFGSSTPTVINVAANWDNVNARWTVSFPISSFSQFRLHTRNLGNAALGVDLESFEVTKSKSENIVAWSTLSEINSKHFEIERSANGFDFKQIGTLASQATRGNSSSRLNYEFIDQNPMLGFNYYRLKAVDWENDFTQSDIKHVYWSVGGSTVRLYPNPTNGMFKIDIETEKVAQMEVRVLDISGRVIKSTLYQSVSGSNQTNMDISSMARGIYQIQILENNRQVYTNKIRKN